MQRIRSGGRHAAVVPDGPLAGFDPGDVVTSVTVAGISGRVMQIAGNSRDGQPFVFDEADCVEQVVGVDEDGGPEYGWPPSSDGGWACVVVGVDEDGVGPEYGDERDHVEPTVHEVRVPCTVRDRRMGTALASAADTRLARLAVARLRRLTAGCMSDAEVADVIAAEIARVDAEIAAMGAAASDALRARARVRVAAVVAVRRHRAERRAAGLRPARCPRSARGHARPSDTAARQLLHAPRPPDHRAGARVTVGAF
jgi:hypothetical protein